MDYQNAFNFSGKVALVTGGAQSIGREIAVAFASCGAQVAIFDILDGRGEAAVEALPGVPDRHGYYHCDVSDPAEIDRAVAAVAERFGRIDFLASNAGVFLSRPVRETTLAAWDRLHAINLRGCFWMCRAVGEHMIRQGGGKIVNTASSSSVINSPLAVAYASTKAAVAHMTRTLANDWAQYHINVNAVSPGFAETELIRESLKDPAWVKANTTRIPMGRFGRAEEVAGAVLFLCSPLAGYITGRNLVIDGGRTLY